MMHPMKMVRLRTIFVMLLLLGVSTAQTPVSSQEATTQTPTLRTKSTVVLVPALVKDNKGEVIYGLEAKDFTIEDDGVTQAVRLDETPDAEPVSLVVALQRSGRADYEFSRMRGLASMLQPLMDQGKTRVALVLFDSQVQLMTGFTANAGVLDAYLKAMMSGDGGAATMDAVKYSVHMLEEQPKERRRVLLLISETRDHGSKTKLKDAVAAIQNSNTVVYSLSFSPTISNFKDTMQGRNEAELSNNMDFIGAPLLLAINAMRKNVPKAIAESTGGEYELFKTGKGFDSLMNSFDNHLHSRYLLSFEPKAPHTGLHTVKVMLHDPQKASVLARTGYWVEEDVPAQKTEDASGAAGSGRKTLAENKPKSKGFHSPELRDMYKVHEGGSIDELGLSDGETAEVLAVIRGGMPRDLLDANAPDDLKEQLLARHVDMGEGVENGLAVVIKPFCNRNGKNCGLVLFHKTGTEWKLMDWFGEAPDAAMFAFAAPKHEGLFDLIVDQYTGGGRFQTQVWQYKGAKYKKLKSYICHYSDGEEICMETK